MASLSKLEEGGAASMMEAKNTKLQKNVTIILNSAPDHPKQLKTAKINQNPIQRTNTSDQTDQREKRGELGRVRDSGVMTTGPGPGQRILMTGVIRVTVTAGGQCLGAGLDTGVIMVRSGDSVVTDSGLVIK